ncbi:hypothetical protein [Cellulomonas sp. ATA003]|uniref:hypothetical protein n=1 Tax=Cellulomonas sp. ATA003 TaxID=3073064 RepID=UPI002872F414|nr:hypothetical protein [Cellulomonas sp. ATA003]WNB85412.1 hypothetical protein REH70_17810 [Cellulomonas sp. ATA003]
MAAEALGEVEDREPQQGDDERGDLAQRHVRDDAAQRLPHHPGTRRDLGQQVEEDVGDGDPAGRRDHRLLVPADDGAHPHREQVHRGQDEDG